MANNNQSTFNVGNDDLQLDWKEMMGSPQIPFDAPPMQQMPQPRRMNNPNNVRGIMKNTRRPVMMNDPNMQMQMQSMPAQPQQAAQMVSHGGDVQPQAVQTGNAGNADNAANAGMCAGTFAVMGYNIPKQTIYLIIAIVLIAIGIWYMNSRKNKNKKNKKDKKDKSKVEKKSKDSDGENDDENE
jgi:preprotein translocase subunit SecG